jgi:tetratricopeptide (TPR) repeat protein
MKYAVSPGHKGKPMPTPMFKPGRLAPPDSVLALALYMRAGSWADFGDLDLAIADYSAALAINPMFEPALAERGAVWAEKGDFDRAIADYNAALCINPRDANTRTNLATALEQKYEGETRNPVVLH